MAKKNTTDTLNGGDGNKATVKAVKHKTTPKVDWSIFDSIWGLTFTGYPERKAALEKEFKRVGILDSGRFNWRFTFPSIFDNILFDVTKKQLKHNTCMNVPVMSCAMGHYGCIKTAYELGHNFALFLEDDIRFLKDIGKLAEIFKMIPPCGDVINFDVLPSGRKWNREKYDNMVRGGTYNDEFFSYYDMCGASCYALSRKAMRAICIRYEQSIFPADDYTSGIVNLGKDVSYYASKTAACCQVTFGKSMNVNNYGKDTLHAAYACKGLNYSDYNIKDVDDYAFGSKL